MRLPEELGEDALARLDEAYDVLLRAVVSRFIPRYMSVLPVFEFNGIGRYFGRVGLIPSLEGDPFRGEWTL